MPRVAIYCRLSDEDRNKANSIDDSESIQNQKAILTRYATEQGWDIHRIYSDEDYSGLDIDRPEWNRLLMDAEAGRFHIVLCKSQSRFTRDMELTEKYLHNRFVEWGIRFIGLTDHTDTSQKGNKKQRQIIGLTNEWYCEDISENIRAVFDSKRKEGRFIGSFAAYGYKKDPLDKNRLIVDDDAAKVVRMIFSSYLEGYGVHHIALMLNAARTPNPACYKRNAGLPFANGSRFADSVFWSRTTVRRILENEVYIGNMVQGKRRKISYKSGKIVSTPRNQWFRVENTHDPIIDREVFSEVRRRIDGRQKSSGSGQAHVLSTKVRCGDCGRSMNRVNAYGRDGTIYSYLRCKTYAATGEPSICTSHTIRLDVLCEVISTRLRDYSCRLLDEEQVLFFLQKHFPKTEGIRNRKWEAEEVEKQLRFHALALKTLYSDRVRNIITQEQFEELNRSFAADRNALAKRKEDLERQLKGSGGLDEHDGEDVQDGLDKTDDMMPDDRKWIEIVGQHTDFQELDHITADMLIDYVEIGEWNQVTEEQRITIHWLF